MIAKTEQEKKALKEAKQKYNKAVQQHKLATVERNKLKEAAPKYTFDRTSILPSEQLLNDSYPVYGDYLYVIDDNGGKVIRSDVFGTVGSLKKDLRSLGHKAENVYSCDFISRRKPVL